MTHDKHLRIEKKILHVPPLAELAEVLNDDLKKSFSQVEVEVVDCPDLTQKPFTLARKGLSGTTKLVEIGSPAFLLPTANKTKLYDLKHIIHQIDSEPSFIIGAGAGPFPYAGLNCEGIYNLYLDEGVVDQHTRIAFVNPENESEAIQEILPNNETRVALLANLFFSEGNPGKVIKVHVKKRIGNDDFIASIRKILEQRYQDKLIGLGGTFILKEGKAKQHVMPDFSKKPLLSNEDLNNWLKFYEMSAPLIAVGTLINSETDLDLRVQHFHSFSHHDNAGHYHIDTTPDTAEYLGYFNVAEEVYRIDKPQVKQTYGKD